MKLQGRLLGNGRPNMNCMWKLRPDSVIFHQQVFIMSFRYSQLIVLRGKLIVAKSNVMAGDVVVIPGGQPEPKIQLGSGLVEQ